MADVSAQHDGGLILENVGGKAGPDSQPKELIKGGAGYNSIPHKHKRYLCCSGKPHLSAICPILCQTCFVELLFCVIHRIFFYLASTNYQPPWLATLFWTKLLLPPPQTKTTKKMRILVLRDAEWITWTVVVASNLLHVEDSQDPVTNQQIMHESLGILGVQFLPLYIDLFIWLKSRPLKKDVVKLEADGRGGRQLIGHGDGDLDIFSISGLTQHFRLLKTIPDMRIKC